ncbi:hypothetical protein C3L33_15506, partial [Rhododendron williamsianum]
MGCTCFGVSIVWRKSGDARDREDLEGKQLGNIHNFSHNELRNATDNFHRSNKLGQGGFGIVYKGILKDGTEVAVKTLSAESKQGVHEFLTEISTISNVRHPNLVELIGCCAQGTNRALVYEYLENNSLDRALLGRVTHTVLLEQAWQLYEEGKLLELVDPELNDFPEEEITRYIKVAFFCTQAVANRRPLMSQVIEMLSRNIRLNEKQLTAPGYFQESGSLSELPFSNKKSSESSTSYQMSSAPITVTQVTPR